ncbi:MAG: 6,7-dimethyl-8-ribityllumazine synthase [Verrucomicrobiota bacterium]
MSNFLPTRPRAIGGKRHIAIVASRFNEKYVEGLVQHASTELRALVSSLVLTVHHVSGAFEIPVVARELASQKKVEAILALGVILAGDTKHAQHLAQSVTNALQQIAIEHGVPVINAVLDLDDEWQAQERCLGSEINRGTEAARAAVEVADVLVELRGR